LRNTYSGTRHFYLALTYLLREHNERRSDAPKPARNQQPLSQTLPTRERPHPLLGATSPESNNTHKSGRYFMHGQHQAGSLPSRVYERHGVRIYSIGYKRPNGTWAFRLSCHISDQEEIAALREEAIHRGTGDQQDCLHSKTFSTVAKHWLNWQKTLPPDSAEKRADSTLAENEREVAQLIRAFGRRRVTAPAEAINAASLAFKKALIERALAG